MGWKNELDLRDWLKRVAPRLGSDRVLRWDDGLRDEDGSGACVALLDSGLCWSHPVFCGAIIRARDFTGCRDLRDPTGHGTANASLLVGQGNGWIRGLVPGSSLLFAKVLGLANRRTAVRAIARGIHWAVSQRADVIVLPFGASRGSTHIARAIRRAAASGCALFAAAGNRGPDEICFPAWHLDVTAVSSLDSDGKSQSRCCGREDVDIFAPGEDVPAVWPDGRAFLQGSSPATVLTAGVRTLLCAAAHKRLGARPQHDRPD